MVYDPQIIAEGKRILLLPYPPLPVWNKFMQFLRSAGIAYVARGVHVKFVLVDPSNRDGAMVNGPDAQGNLAKIKKIGADMTKLKDAVAIELPKDPKARAMIIERNKFMIDTSSETLAPLSGVERYRSIGCSHSSQSIRAALARCRTDVDELAIDGRMDRGKIVADDDELGVMFDVGWDWEIVPEEAIEVWPECVVIGSTALNASNSVPTLPSETSCMLCIQAFIRQGRTESQAMAKILERAPACSDYIKSVAQAATLFNKIAMDDDSIIKLNRYASKHGGSIKLGGEFLIAVTDTQFHDRRGHNMTRLAHLYTNIVSPKIEHGVGVLIKPNHVKKLWGDAKQVKALDNAERFFEQLCTLLVNHAKKGLITPAQEVALQGRAFIRAVLLMHEKEGEGIETVKFKALDKIKAQFKAELLTILGKKNVKLPWDAESADDEGDESDDSQGGKDAAADSATKTDVDPKSATNVAMKEGFKVGGYCCEKVVGPSVAFEIVSIDASKVCLKMVVTRLQTDTSNDVDFCQFLNNFKEVRERNVIREIQGTAALLAAPNAPVFQNWENAHNLMNAILEAENSFKHDINSDFVFLTSGMIVAAKNFAIGKLRLAPVCTVSERCDDKQSSKNTTTATVDNVKFRLEPPKPPLSPTFSTKMPDGNDTATMLVPFWWVKAVPNKAVINMELKPHKMPSKIIFDIFVNICDVKAGDELTSFNDVTTNSIFAPPKASPPAPKATKTKSNDHAKKPPAKRTKAKAKL